MAGQEKKIIQGVTIEDRTFLPGEEEELAEVASKEQIEHLTTQGAIQGFGGEDQDPDEASREKYGKEGAAQRERTPEAKVAASSKKADEAQQEATKATAAKRTAKASKRAKPKSGGKK